MLSYITPRYVRASYYLEFYGLSFVLSGRALLGGVKTLELKLGAKILDPFGIVRGGKQFL